MDSDDDLMIAPKPAPKAPITFDDSDDDLLAPPPAKAAPHPAAGAAGPASPTGRGAVTLEDSDDDLLPPTNASMAASPKNIASSSPSFHRDPASVASPTSAAPHTAAPVNAPVAVASPTSRSAAVDAEALAESVNRTKAFVKKQLNKEGFMSKLQPTWPYNPQRRWCVLQGRMFSYYDSQAATKPSATLDLKGAEIVIDPQGAREPNSFGIANIQSGSSGNGGAASLKGRVFIFSTLTKEEMMEWVEALRSVLNDGHSEVHWFEKMTQGAF